MDERTMLLGILIQWMRLPNGRSRFRRQVSVCPKELCPLVTLAPFFPLITWSVPILRPNAISKEYMLVL